MHPELKTAQKREKRNQRKYGRMGKIKKLQIIFLSFAFLPLFCGFPSFFACFSTLGPQVWNVSMNFVQGGRHFFRGLLCSRKINRLGRVEGKSFALIIKQLISKNGFLVKEIRQKKRQTNRPRCSFCLSTLANEVRTKFMLTNNSIGWKAFA